ncbi:MAG: hypothetical protein LBK60_11655, partial [Verrucomicrobiales bacterium]|nr:hypothetical protein [Verrucomicrobiales bacterium]
HYDKRRLGALLAKVGAGDLIICAELSRLGRTLFMIMDILKPSLVQPPLGFVLCFFPTHRTASTTRLGRKITLKTSLFASKTMRNDAKSPRKLELCSCKKTGNTPIGNVLIKRPITT